MDNTGIEKRVILVKKRNVFVARSGKGKSYGCIILSKIAPFRLAMMIQLKRRGINIDSLNFKTLVILFYNEFCAGSYPVSEFINNVAFKLTPSDSPTNDINDIRVKTSFDIVNEVTDCIVKRFKESKGQYDTLLLQGFEPKQLMTDENILQAKAVISIEKRLLKKSKSDHYLKSSEVTGWLKWIVGIVIMVFILREL